MAKKTVKEEPLEKQLWAAADKLRKNIDAAEYKHIVLGLIFLKYISDAFEELHSKLIADKRTGADPEDNRNILEGYRTPLPLESGRVLAVDARGRLASLTLDAETATVVTQPVIVLEGLGLSSGIAGVYDVSDDGMLVYRSGDGTTAEGGGMLLAWVDASGGIDIISQRPGDFQIDSRVSPDGSRLVLEATEDGTTSVWVHEIERDVRTALTPGAVTSFPVWSPDGRDVVYTGGEDPAGIFVAPVDRSRAPELLLENPPERFLLPTDWSRDGSMILYVSSPSPTRVRDGGNDLWLLPTDGSEPREFLATDASEVDPRFSPDGRWIAYQSDQTGRSEIYVRGVEGGGEFRISGDGGVSPEWNPAGGQIFFERGRTLWAVEIDTAGATPAVAQESLLLNFPPQARVSLWSPHPEGDRFLMSVLGDGGGTGASQLVAILNWPVLRR